MSNTSATDLFEALLDSWNRHNRILLNLLGALSESVQVVGEAVKARWLAVRGLDRHNDHPILFLQHMIWHEGYHHGQIKLALKLAGIPLTEKQVGRATWGVWMKKA